MYVNSWLTVVVTGRKLQKTKPLLFRFADGFFEVRHRQARLQARSHNSGDVYSTLNCCKAAGGPTTAAPARELHAGRKSSRQLLSAYPTRPTPGTPKWPKIVYRWCQHASSIPKGPTASPGSNPRGNSGALRACSLLNPEKLHSPPFDTPCPSQSAPRLGA